VYERYADPARRAIFFSLWYSRLGESPAADSVHLLKGLMYDETFRANTMFRLREHFVLHCSCPSKFATCEEVPEIKPVLADDVKRILARTGWEADALRDYWIDTEHFVLGILAEPSCRAAQYLAKAGLTLNDSRCAVVENKISRPDYGPVPDLWSVQSPWERLMFKWRMHRLKKQKAGDP
jgi:Clp amino terminal domain, pathogenicity island component